MSDEQKQLLSDLAKERTGVKNHFFGKQHTEETKRKIREQNELTRSRIDCNAPNSRPVMVNGIVYKSSMDACRKLHIKRAIFSHRLRSKLDKYANYQYADKRPTTIETATTVERE